MLYHTIFKLFDVE